MSRINDLIRDLCPDGVEYKPLGELVEIFSGHAFNSTHFNKIKTGLPLIRIRDINTGFSDTYYSGPYQNQYVANSGDLLIGMDGDFHIVHWSQGKALLNQRVCRLQNIDSELNKRFLFHIMTPTLKHIQNESIKSTVKHLSVKQLRSAQIPLPPLEVQKEIAKTLDQFTQLEAELEAELSAELEARQQQYFHYCASAFNSAADVEWTTLERVSLKISSGGTPSSSNSAYYGGDIPWVRSQDVNFNMISSTSATISNIGLKNSAAKWIPSNSLIVAMYGASAARAAINTIPVTTNQACCNLQLDTTKVTPRYAYHWIYSQYDKLRSLGEGSQSNLNARKIKNYPIPVPSLNEQRRITDALDEFHSLVNDLSSGLPAEIEARRKQYEYYRDRLLTFPEKK
ncbi:MAG: restriction endonuclease subunit S [Actinomyces sp.]